MASTISASSSVILERAVLNRKRIVVIDSAARAHYAAAAGVAIAAFGREALDVYKFRIVRSPRLETKDADPTAKARKFVPLKSLEGFGRSSRAPFPSMITLVKMIGVAVGPM